MSYLSYRALRMAENRVFFPQQALDHWLEQGRITLVDAELTIAPAARRLRLVSALRFMTEVGGAEDAHGLVGKVKSIEDVLALEGEHYADSVVLGDNAYTVIEGFLGHPLPAASSKRAASMRPLPPSDEPDPLAPLFEPDS
jgi:hypothetical protein